MVSEEDRAIEYRRQSVARVNAKIAREKALAGDPSVMQLLYDSWAPLLPDTGWDPPPGPEDEK
jgi:hypothetical protein